MWTSSSSSFSSTSLSSSISSSSPSPYAAFDFRLPRTREEVWNDISLAASDLHHQPSSRGMIFQDFFSKDPPPTSGPSPGFSTSPPPQPPTLLTLNSGPLLFPHHQIQPMSHALDVGVVKMFPETNRSSGDRRNKRMIKNRESAARSRARKQAYTNELELEVAHLLEENAKLRKQQEQFYREAAADSQKGKPLHRTSTAPF